MSADRRVGAVMGRRPLLTVVTPTWQRAELLAETVEHIRAQTYRPLEHVVISDGPDPAVRALVAAERGYPDVAIRCVELARNWSGLMPASFGIAPLTVGYLAARGEYIANLSDDDRMHPDYLARLVDLIEEAGADFAYSKARFYWHDERPQDGYDIGSDPPCHGQITAFVARASCFWRFGMPQWGTHPVDWALVDQWMAHGARWAYLPEVLFWHRADQEEGRAR